ncbi:MAG: hypothetical protein Q9195_003209 [Heterodermia aff. obscurata]
MPGHPPGVRLMEPPDKQKAEDRRRRLFRGKTLVYATLLSGRLESGMMQTGDFHLHKTTPLVSTDQGIHSRSEGSHHHPTPTTRDRDNESIRRKNLEAENALRSRPGGLVAAHTARVEASPSEEIWDSESQSSRRDMITKTRTWNVQYHSQA